LAAVATSIGSYYIHIEHIDMMHKVASYLGTLIGGITFTGSIAAFLKLSGIKWTFDLPMKKHLNKPLSLVNLLTFAGFLSF
jgi:NAD(P) transhydrogenase